MCWFKGVIVYMSMLGHDSFHGIGLGLRYPFAEALLKARPQELTFLEIHPENYIERGGRYPAMLEGAQAHWPLLTHGLTLGLGNTQRFDPQYTALLRRFLKEQVRAPWHSEHLCFTEVKGHMLHDLLPLPFNQEAIDTAVTRIQELQDALELPIAVENVSYYANLDSPHMSEVDFLLEVMDRADALLLLDVNNVYVNSINHRFDPYAYLDRIPAERVVQIHIAGHWVHQEGVIIDTHAEPISEPVYALLEYALHRLGPRPVLLERDDNFPDFPVLMAEVKRLSHIYKRATKSLRVEACTV